MIELTADQHDALANNGAEPARAIDPVTKDEYVLLKADAYERIKRLLSDDANWVESAFEAALPVFARDGWDDPRMDVYDSLDPRKQP